MRTKTIPFILLLLISLMVKSQTKISGIKFGLNLWVTDYKNAPFGPITTSLNPTQWTMSKLSGGSLIRIGGQGYNLETPSSPSSFPHTGNGNGSTISYAGYVQMVDDIRLNGLEPMITIPFEDRSKTKNLYAQALDAAEIVKQVNIIHKRAVKYWIISNEPTKDQGYTSSTQDIRNIRDYIKAYSVEMKKIDPDILIIGPELESEDPNFLNPLFSNPNTNLSSISGTIPATWNGIILPGNVTGKYFVDYLSYHTYPGYGSTMTTTLMSIRQRYVEQGYKVMTSFANTYTNYINNPSVGYNRTGNLKIMLDEFNMGDIDAPYASSLTAASVTAEVRNSNTFLAGQLVTDIMAASMMPVDASGNAVYECSNIWGIKEGQQGFGILHNNDPKPTYWHYWMVAKHFKGEFYKTTTVPTPSTQPRCYKAYACKAGNYIAVLVMNQAQNTNSSDAGTYSNSTLKNFTINFDNQPSSDFVFNMGAGWGANVYSGSINNKSSALLFFNCSGSTPTLLGRYDYEEAGVAANPTTYSPTVTGNIPIIPTITVTGGTCTGSTATLTAPATATWYASYNNYISAIGSPSTVLTTTIPGIYQAKITGSCTDYWIAAVVSLTSPIISASTHIVQNCSGSTATLGIKNGVANYSWSPTTSPSTGATVTANPSSNTVYTVTATSSGCSTTETISLLAGSSNTTSQNLIIRDDVNDLGAEPNTTANNVWWTSPDMWISQTYGGSASNGEYKTNGDPNYVHVVVRNSGNSTASGILNVYWTKGAMWAPWASSWINSFTTTSTFTISLGDQLGKPIPITVAANSSTTVIIPWIVPNPLTYTPVVIQNHINHFCLYARVDNGCGSTVAETPWVYYNCQQNKNIAAANIDIYDANLNDMPPFGGFSGLLVVNSETLATPVHIKVHGLSNTYGETIFDFGNPYILMDTTLYNEWVAGGSQGINISDMGDYLIKITGNDAELQNITLSASELRSLATRFTFTTQPDTSHRFEVDLTQYDDSGVNSLLLGGQRYLILPPVCPTVNVVNATINIGERCTATMEVDDPQDHATYTWYGPFGLIGTGSSQTVSPNSNTTYTVETAKNGCVSTATVLVQIRGESCSGRVAAAKKADETANISGIRPNPAFESTLVSYTLNENEDYELLITNSIGQILFRKALDQKSTNTQIDCNKYGNGIYYVSLVSGKKTYKTYKLIVVK
jgi:hypothetical protein